MNHCFNSIANRLIENRKYSLALALLLAPVAAFAGRSAAFGVDAFNAACPPDPSPDPSAPAASCVFSPFGFELDCCALAEAFDTITRANIAERMGVLIDFNAVYQPLLAHLSATTNGYSILSARALCLPDPDYADTLYRRALWEMSGASVCLSYPTHGANSWFRAKMDGEREDFALPLTTRPDRDRYTFADVLSLRFALGGEGEPPAVSNGVLRVRREVAYAAGEHGLTVRVPLQGGAFLYLFTPSLGKSLADLRRFITGDTIRDLLLAPDSLTAKDCGRMVADLTLPALDLTSTIDLSPALVFAQVPAQGFAHLDNSLAIRTAFQSARMVLSSDGRMVKSSDHTTIRPYDHQTSNSNTLNSPTHQLSYLRPFVFLVHFPETDVIPVMGQYTGH